MVYQRATPSDLPGDEKRWHFPPPSMMSDDLPFDGERFLPECRGEMWLEHWHRYHLVRPLARKRRVLDIACGEGYGAALLAGQDNDVWGVDLSSAAIGHAQETYGVGGGLKFAIADCRKLPFADSSFDLVVSFETIEHITEQREFLGEVRRVLAPEGAFLLSSPNKQVYSDQRQYQNEFHVGELYREDLADLLAAFFPVSRWFCQRNSFVSMIWRESIGPSRLELPAQWINADATAPCNHAGPPEAMYFLCALGASADALEFTLPDFSVLGDRSEFVYRDYVQAVRDVRRIEPAREALAAQLWTAEHLLTEARALLAEREQNACDLKAEVRSLEQQLMRREAEATDYRSGLAVEREQAGIEGEALRSQIANLTKQTFDLQAAAARDGSKLRELDSRLREREQIVVRQAGELTRRAHEINRRASIFWWFKLPWLRLLKKLPPMQ